MKRPFQCDVCSHRFTRKDNMLKHRKHFHENVLDVKKPLLVCKSKLEASLQCNDIHKANERIKRKPFQCDVCGSRFTRKNNMLKHRKHFHENILDVEKPQLICKSKMKTSLQWDDIYKANKRKPFQCDVCGSRFTQKGNMLKHKKHFHEDILEVKKSLPICKSKMKTSLLCDECNLKFTHKDSFARHHKKLHKDDCRVQDQSKYKTNGKKACKKNMSNQQESCKNNICKDALNKLKETNLNANDEYNEVKYLLEENITQNALDQDSGEEASPQKPRRSCCVM